MNRAKIRVVVMVVVVVVVVVVLVLVLVLVLVVLVVLVVVVTPTIAPRGAFANGGVYICYPSINSSPCIATQINMAVKSV